MNKNIVIDLPYINITIAAGVERHSLTSFHLLPQLTYHFTDNKSGKKVPLHFWIKDGKEDITSYDRNTVSNVIYESMVAAINTHELMGEGAGFTYTSNLQEDLVKSIICASVGEKSKLAEESATITSAPVGHPNITTMFIPAGVYSIQVNLHEGVYDPANVKPSLMEALTCLLAKEDKSNHFRYEFHRGDKQFTAIIKFKEFDYGDWFASSTLFETINDALDRALANIVATFGERN